MEILDAIPRKLRTRYLPWEAISIMPIGDFQLGSPGTDLKHIKEHVKWGVDNGVFFLGMGDYTDFLSPSNRRYLKNSGLYDTAQDIIETVGRQHLETLQSILEPTKGMWLGLHEGHHLFEFGDGTTTDTELARFLDAPFLGTAAVTRLTFKDHNRHSVDCLTWSHHGEGSGATDPVQRLKKVAPGFPQVDIFVQGHNTKLGSESVNNIWFYGGPGRLQMRSKKQMFVAAGGFMTGYTQGSKFAGRASGSYVERGMMRPSAIGAPIIRVEPRYKNGYADLSMHCSV